MLEHERQTSITLGTDFYTVRKYAEVTSIPQHEADMKTAANLDFTDDEAGPELRNTTWKWEDTGYWFSG